MIILPILIGILKLLFAICFWIPSYVHQELLFFTYLETLLAQDFIFERDLQFSKFLKNTICIGLCKLKYTEKHLIPFTPLHFLP